jgi:hypothetical protein
VTACDRWLVLSTKVRLKVLAQIGIAMRVPEVQYVSHVSMSSGSSGNWALVLALGVLVVLTIAAVLLAKEWRQSSVPGISDLVRETERWLRDQ